MTFLEAELDLVFTVINIVCVFVYVKLIAYWIAMDGAKMRTQHHESNVKVVDTMWYDDETGNHSVSNVFPFI